MRPIFAAGLVGAGLFWLASGARDAAAMCPFCTVPQPTFAERREQALVMLVGELAETAGQRQTFRVHHVLKGADRVPKEAPLVVPTVEELRPGSLVVLLGFAGEKPEGRADAPPPLVWEGIAADETRLVYFVHVPDLRRPAAERLTYFARHLEHRDAVIAADAYGEFGRAPFDVVAAAADRLSMSEMRRWLADESVPQERKGFYGMALGLATTESDRRENLACLRTVIETPASEFRSGFDGVVAGYIWLSGEPGLAWIETRYLTDPRAERGDVLHVMTALRFLAEYSPSFTRARLGRALVGVLDRAEFAARAIVDLARWQAWDELPRVAGLYGRPGYADRATRRAIVGFLLACPRPEAGRALADLRRLDPSGTAEAEQSFAPQGDPR